MDENRKQLTTFLLLTLLLSAVFYTLIIKSGHLASAAGSYVLSLMWCPAVAAMLTCKLFGRDLGTLGWKWGETRYQVMSYCIPLLYATITYAVVWLTRLGGFYDWQFVSGVAK
ncbi:MAG TPA: CPBP family intramembrane glutamate endopeptidase, partial [Candidatus Angelobacter sp.]|nr:CPBP family intramembrane glutamate endopeptidase [Candidatus Angelobacter sp.]